MSKKSEKHRKIPIEIGSRSLKSESPKSKSGTEQDQLMRRMAAMGKDRGWPKSN
jgi:hypothetical protein